MSYWFEDEAVQPQVPASQRRQAPIEDDFLRDVRVAADAYEANRDLGIYVDNTVGRANAIEEAYDRRIDAVKKATGVQLENPSRLATPPGQWIEEARGLGLSADAGPAAAREALVKRAEEQFATRLGELVDGSQDKEIRAQLRAHRRPIIEDARQIGRNAAERAALAGSADTSRPYTRFIAGMAGSLAGGFRDPLNVGIAAATGPIGAGRTGGWLVLRNILGDGVVNAAGEAALQPQIMAWRRELGLEAGWQEAAKNVGTAAVFGGAIRGAIEVPGVVRSLARPAQSAPDALPSLPAAMEDVPGTFPRDGAPAAPAPSDVPPGTILAALNGDDDAMIRAAREAADELDPAALAAADAIEADRLVRGLAPEGISDQDHARNFAQAVRFAENPGDELPALPFDPVPARREDAPPLPDAAPGQRFDYLKKPVTFENVDAATLGTDAATFQYKGGGDAGGVTERLRSVTRWDNLASGKVAVFERTDGTRVIADGHQRLGLARRLLAEGREQKIDLNGFVFREADGWTPADVRAIAAKKNLQEGSGDVVDTARVLRERPTILDGSVATGSEHMRQARGLARLSDDAFGMVVNGTVAPNHAAVVGELIGDKSMHSAAVQLLGGVEDLTTARARYMVADMARAPSTREVQETLLGVLDRTVPLVVERARVLDRAIGSLRKEKSAFRTVLANAGRLENAGNIIAEQGSQAAVDAAGNAIAAIEKLALRSSAISDALDRAALAIAGGQRIGNATDAFVREVTDLVEQRGLVALATEAPAPARVAMDDPIGTETTEQSDALYGNLFGADTATRSAEASPAVSPQRRRIESAAELMAGQPHADIDAVYRVAPALQDELAAVGVTIGRETGAEWHNPGLKRRETAEAKIGRKGYRSPNQITDIVRGGFVVDTPQQADAIAQQLAARFDALDEGWKVNDTGYYDRKVLVRFDDGTVGEVQVWPRRMYEAKKLGGKLYRQRRALEPGNPQRAELATREVDIYSAAAREAGEPWSAAVASSGRGGSSPNVVENAERIASSEGSTSTPSNTSSASTSDQGSLGASTDQARSRSEVLTAGRASQSRKNMADTSGETVDPARPEGNDRQILDDVTHTEDVFLGMKRCALGENDNG